MLLQGNATLLFKRSLNEPEERRLSEDTDYVNFENHKTLKKTHSEVRSLLSQDMQKSFDLLIKEAENGNALSEEKHSTEINQNDRQVTIIRFL